MTAFAGAQTTGIRYVKNPDCRCGGFPVTASVAVPVGGDCYNDTYYDFDCPVCGGKTQPIQEVATGIRCKWCGTLDVWHTPDQIAECERRFSMK